MYGCHGRVSLNFQVGGIGQFMCMLLTLTKNNFVEANDAASSWYYTPALKQSTFREGHRLDSGQVLGGFPGRFWESFRGSGRFRLL